MAQRPSNTIRQDKLARDVITYHMNEAYMFCEEVDGTDNVHDLCGLC